MCVTGLPMDIAVDLMDISAFNGSFHGIPSPLFNATFIELFGHMDLEGTDTDTGARVLPGGGRGGHTVHYSEFNVTAESVPPHGSRLFRVTAQPSRWIPNHGTAAVRYTHSGPFSTPFRARQSSMIGKTWFAT